MISLFFLAFFAPLWVQIGLHEMTVEDITGIEGISSEQVSLLGIALGDTRSEAHDKMAALPRGLRGEEADENLLLKRPDGKTVGGFHFGRDGRVEMIFVNGRFSPWAIGTFEDILSRRSVSPLVESLWGAPERRESGPGFVRHIWKRKGIAVKEAAGEIDFEFFPIARGVVPIWW